MLALRMLTTVVAVACALSVPPVKTNDLVARQDFDFSPPGPDTSDLSSQVFTKSIGFRLSPSAKYPSWPQSARTVGVEVSYKYVRTSAPFVGAIGMVEASGTLKSATGNITTLVTGVNWSETGQQGNVITGQLQLTFTFGNARGDAQFTYAIEWTDEFIIGKSKDDWQEKIQQVTRVGGTCEVGFCHSGVKILRKGEVAYSIAPMSD